MDLPALIPFRVALMPAVTRLPVGWEGRSYLTAVILEHIVYRCLAYHRTVNVLEPGTLAATDGRGRLIDADHARSRQWLTSAFTTWRRDAVIWLEVDLRSEDAPGCALRLCHRWAAAQDALSFPAESTHSLSMQIERVLDTALQAIGHGPCPAPMEPFDMQDLLGT
ncbi:MAG: hypothetical protein QF464_13870, partial [Myxococcota bacterium]|nr:hypothetical protein [Myxococcota bacterium]